MKRLFLLSIVLFSFVCYSQSGGREACRNATLDALKNTFESKTSNFYIKFDNLYMEIDLKSPHTLSDIRRVPDSDGNLYNQAREQAYQLFKRMDDIGILKEGGTGRGFNCDFIYYYVKINYVTTDGQLLPFMMYISRRDVQAMVYSFNRMDFQTGLKRFPI